MTNRLYDITYRDGDVEFRVPRERVVFLSRPEVVDMVLDSTYTHALNPDPNPDLVHEDVKDPEMGEMIDFTDV